MKYWIFEVFLTCMVVLSRMLCRMMSISTIELPIGIYYWQMGVDLCVNYLRKEIMLKIIIFHKFFFSSEMKIFQRNIEFFIVIEQKIGAFSPFEVHTLTFDYLQQN